MQIKKNIKKILISLSVFALLFVNSNIVFADDPGDVIGLGYVDDIGLQKPDDLDPQGLMISIIKYLMTFLGIIAVSIILYGGFIWMTAGGNDDRVGKAKKIIIAGLSGLIVVLSAYAIITFVTDTTTDILEDGDYDGP